MPPKKRVYTELDFQFEPIRPPNKRPYKLPAEFFEGDDEELLEAEAMEQQPEEPDNESYEEINDAQENYDRVEDKEVVHNIVPYEIPEQQEHIKGNRNDIEIAVPVAEPDKGFVGRDKKFFTLEIGRLGSDVDQIVTANLNTTWRVAFDITSGITKGLNRNQRTGNRITVTRISWRVYFGYAPSMSDQSINAIASEALFRFFIYQKKTAGTISNAADLGQPPNTALPGFNTQDDTNVGFLDTASILSFYRLQNISNYRIWHDSGVQALVFEDGNVQYAYAGLGQQSFPTGDQGHEEDVKMNVTLIGITNAEGGGNIEGNLEFPEQFASLGSAAPGGVGTIDGLITPLVIPLTNNLDINTVETELGPAGGLNQILFRNLTKNDYGVLTKCVRPKERLRYFEGNFDVKIPVDYGNQTNPRLNGIRFGTLIFTPAFAVRYGFSLRVEYLDD